MSIVWVRISSWHALRAFELAAPTLCGRRAGPQADVSSELPMGEKSCESCARLILHAQDKANPDYPDTDAVPVP